MVGRESSARLLGMGVRDGDEDGDEDGDGNERVVVPLPPTPPLPVSPWKPRRPIRAAGGKRQLVFGVDDLLLAEKVRSIPRADVAEAAAPRNGALSPAQPPLVSPFSLLSR